MAGICAHGSHYMPACGLTKSWNKSRTMLNYSDLYSIVSSLIIHQLH